MQSGDGERLEGIAEEPPTTGTGDDFDQELLDFSQELESAASMVRDGDAEDREPDEAVSSTSAAAGSEEVSEFLTQEVVEEVSEKGRDFLVQLVKATTEIGDQSQGLGRLDIVIAGQLRDFDQGTLIGIGIAGVQCGHELRRAQERLGIQLQQQAKLKLERDSLIAQLSAAELRAGGAESQLTLLQQNFADERANHAAALSIVEAHAARIRQLEEANAKLEEQTRAARRSTIFGPPGDASASGDSNVQRCIEVLGVGEQAILVGLSGAPVSVMRHGEVEHEITAPSGVLQVVEDLDVPALLPILGAGRDTMLRPNPVTCCAE